MKLVELQKILGERIEIAKDKELTDEQRKIENERSDMVVRIAKQMINNADVILRTDRLIADSVIKKDSNIIKLIK